jgi:hypothetical protein
VIRSIVLLAALALAVGASTYGIPPLVTISALVPAFGVALLAERDFESFAEELTKEGKEASAPASIMGKSGVKHDFAFAAYSDSRRPKVVVDTELSVTDVDEMKVLKFYVKVFDVSPEHAILCVSPKLGERANRLAKEYKLEVVEDETPRNLVMKANTMVRTIVGPAKETVP